MPLVVLVQPERPKHGLQGHGKSRAIHLRQVGHMERAGSQAPTLVLKAPNFI